MLLEHMYATVTTSEEQSSLGDIPLRTFLNTLLQLELVSLLLELAGRYPEVYDVLATRQMLATDNFDELESAILRQIIAASAEPRWDDDRNGHCSGSNYGPVYKDFNLLLDQGQVDAVVRLGKELLDQIEQPHNNTATAIASCRRLVFRVTPRSSLMSSYAGCLTRSCTIHTISASAYMMC